MNYINDNIESYQNLIYAVVATAMRDTFRPPVNGYLDHETESAFNFLFGKDVDIWLELVDMDADQYKTRLKDFMWKDNKETGDRVSEFDKRMFRGNYKLWHKKMNERKLLELGYGTERKWKG